MKIAIPEKKVRGVYEKVRGSGVWWIQYFDSTGRRRRERIGSKSSAMKAVESRRTKTREGVILPENLRAGHRPSGAPPARRRSQFPWRCQGRQGVLPRPRIPGRWLGQWRLPRPSLTHAFPLDQKCLGYSSLNSSILN
jgi:hypothetical protein